MPQGKIILMGNGFALPFWKRRLDAEGLEYKQVDVHFAGDIGDEPADILIETEELPPPPPDHFHEPHDEGEEGDIQREDGNGHGHGPSPVDAPDIDLAEDGLLFVPCYAGSPTIMADTFEDWSENAVGYTLFAPPNEAAAQSPIIELAQPMQAREEIWAAGLSFAEEAGFRYEIVGDAPGLVFGRTLACLINEAAYALGDGIASAADIDTAMRLGVNYPKGLCEWGDEVGLDLVLAILEGLSTHYQEDRYRPSPLLRHLFVAGRKFHVL